jgi:hypothetical protein
MSFNYEASNKAYELFEVEESWKHIIGEDFIFPFNPEWKNIGVNVSGGADSAAGTATLAKIIQDNGYDCKIHFLTNVRVWNNRPWAGPISIEVYNKLKEMFPDVIGERIQNFIPPEIEEGSLRNKETNPEGILTEIGMSGDRICVNSFNRYAVYTYGLEAVYNFITLNPTHFDHDMGPRDRGWDLENLQEEWDRLPQLTPSYDGRWLVQPWKLVEKDFVISQYFRNGWEDLLNTTRSCEGDIKLFPNGGFEDYTTYKHGTSPLHTCLDLKKPEESLDRCCFWCVERDWAINSARTKLGM